MNATIPFGDGFLRRAGFTIVSRPAAGEPLWRDRSGAIVTQSEAVQREVERRRAEHAKQETKGKE